MTSNFNFNAGGVGDEGAVWAVNIFPIKINANEMSIRYSYGFLPKFCRVALNKSVSTIILWIIITARFA